MLRWRLTLGAIFIAALIALFWFDVQLADEGRLPPGLLLVPVALTLSGAATREYLALVRTREPAVSGPLLLVGNWLIVAAPWLGACRGDAATIGQWQIMAFTGAVLTAFLVEIARYDKDSSQHVTERLGLTILGLAYIGLLLSFVVRLRLSPQGIYPLILTLIVVKLCDTGAYFTGKSFGRHKLIPRLSPGKTWEGLAGGLAWAVLGGEGCLFLTTNIIASDSRSNGSILTYVGFALAIGLTGVLGDLAESLLKRDFGVKDSSTWMPGFGGVLDLIDSPLFAAPIAWAFWEFGWLG